MKTQYKYNWKSICVSLIIIIAGICLVLIDIFKFKTIQNLWISIGCSLIASGLVILVTALLTERVPINPLDTWKIDKIYETRAEKNKDSDPELDNAKYCIDAVAFGLKSFRAKQEDRVKGCLERGVDIRILTMNPNSKFTKEREKEENETNGQIKNTINDLVKWADKLNSKNYKGKIIVKGYDTMTLDFYWRVDNTLFVGPYWYGISSQQTITYKFVAGGKGFEVYTKYFEKLWNNENISSILTKQISER